MLKRLHQRLNEQALIDLQTWMADPTAVRTTRDSSGTGKREPDQPADHFIVRSRGGLTTKIHILCDANWAMSRFFLSGRQTSEISYVRLLLDEISIPSSQRSLPHKRCKWLLATRAMRPMCYATTVSDLECAAAPNETQAQARLTQTV